MTPQAAKAAPTPDLVPTVQDRAGQLAALGWTGREAEWLALVALHSGVFTRSQWRHFFNDPHREMVSRFVRAGLGTYCFCLTDQGSITDFGYTEARYGKVTLGPDLDFGFRKEITIDRSKIPTGCGATLLNYPLLFSVTDLDLSTASGEVTDPEGDDIMFRALDDDTCGGVGTAPCTLDHEMESYNATTGAVVAWVRLPSVKTDDASNTTDTKVYVYYGNTDIASSIENADGVWDANYAGVWHLKESGNGTAGEFVDSSGTTNHGQGMGGVPTQDTTNGQIGNAQDFDGALNYIKIPYDATLAPANFTISMWRKADVVEQSATFKSAAGDGYASGYALYGDGTTINLRWGTGSVGWWR